MPYRYTFFDTVPLPDHNPIDDLSTGDVPSTLLETMNGAVDAWGEQLRKLPNSQQIVFKGDYIAQNAVILDGEGRTILVPDPKDKTKLVPLVAGTQFWTYLRNRTDALKAKHGFTGRLYRQPEDEREAAIKAGVVSDLETVGAQWKVCRLLGINHVRELKDINRVARIAITFETRQATWQSTAAPVVVNLNVGGNAVNTVKPKGSELITTSVFTLTATAAPITQAAFTFDDTTWLFKGSIATSKSLVIDTGRETITNGGADAFNSLTITRDRPGWLTLKPRNNSFFVTLAGGPGKLTVEYLDQWT